MSASRGRWGRRGERGSLPFEFSAPRRFPISWRMTRSAPCKPQIPLRATSPPHPSPLPLLLPSIWLQYYFPPPPSPAIPTSAHTLSAPARWQRAGMPMSLIRLSPPAGGRRLPQKKIPGRFTRLSNQHLIPSSCRTSVRVHIHGCRCVPACSPP